MKPAGSESSRNGPGLDHLRRIGFMIQATRLNRIKVLSQEGIEGSSRSDPVLQVTN